MPHIVLSGNSDFDSIYKKFEKSMHMLDSEIIIKYDDCFLNKDENIILIKTIVIENQKSISFYIMIMKKEKQITIRLDPYTDPDKTNNVKKSLALLARKVLEKEKDLEITKTNLQEFI